MDGAILEQNRVKSVLSGERDGTERCGEVLSAGGLLWTAPGAVSGDLSRSHSAHML